MFHSFFKSFAVNAVALMGIVLMLHARCFFRFQVNSVNCNTSWKIVLFMKWSDNQEIVLKGVRDTSARCP